MPFLHEPGQASRGDVVSMRSNAKRIWTVVLGAITAVLLRAAACNRYAAFKVDRLDTELGWCVALAIGALLQLYVVASNCRKPERR
jgi:hypothetical protein